LFLEQGKIVGGRNGPGNLYSGKNTIARIVYVWKYFCNNLHLIKIIEQN